jgi:molybdopterin-guanine dinucleotide biosynthesis protein A
MITLIVAGGRSRRFGRDKRLFCVDGRPLLCASVAIARTLELPVFVALGEDPGRALWPDGVAVWRDRWPGEGPLPAILEALRWRDDDVLCLAADLLGVAPRTLQRLRETADRSSKPVVVADAGRGLEPLLAVYSRSSRPWLEAAVAAGERSLQRVLRAHAGDVEVLGVPAEERWTNLNTLAGRS